MDLLYSYKSTQILTQTLLLRQAGVPDGSALADCFDTVLAARQRRAEWCPPAVLSLLATSVCGLKLRVYEALSYECMRP